jgi:hypothetical protein
MLNVALGIVRADFKGILGRFSTLFFSAAALSFFWQRAACTPVVLILHLTK